MICVKCQTPTCSEHCWDCPAEGRGGRGDVRSSEYNDGYTRGLAERDERVRSLEAALARAENVLADIGDAEGPDRRGVMPTRKTYETWASNALPLIRSALTASAPAGEPSKTHCSECGVSRYGNHIQQPGEHYPRCSKFKAPAGEQEKTSEGDVGREDHSSAPNSTSPPAEAPQESGVPSGKAGCRACDPLNPGDVGEPHTCSPHSPGTLRDDYERMAREWAQEPCSATDGSRIWWVGHDKSDDEECETCTCLTSLAALLARVADERQSAIEQARSQPDLPLQRAGSSAMSASTKEQGK